MELVQEYLLKLDSGVKNSPGVFLCPLWKDGHEWVCQSSVANEKTGWNISKKINCMSLQCLTGRRSGSEGRSVNRDNQNDIGLTTVVRQHVLI